MAGNPLKLYAIYNTVRQCKINIEIKCQLYINVNSIIVTFDASECCCLVLSVIRVIRFTMKRKSKPIYKGDPNVYDVERILKKKINGGKVEYLVKWLNYPESENLWVDESDITPDLLKSFNSEESNRQKQSLDARAAVESLVPNESYIDDNIHNLGVNVQLQSPTDDFQLFSVIRLIGLYG